MAQVGNYNTLKVVKKVDFGLYLDGGEDGEILLPKRFAPKHANPGDEIKVFLYHDSDNRLIATTQEPKGILGDVVMMEVIESTKQGAFLDWGLMKDLFVPLSQQESHMRPGGHYLVKIYKDEQTGRIAATERISRFIDNDILTVKELEPVKLVVWRRSDLGYVVIINNIHEGLLHYNEVFRDLEVGEQIEGFIKTIREDNKIDVALGKRGYEKVESEADKILRLLHENDGYLPYNDKSNPEDIYHFFEMSKKTFKMAAGALFKQRKISFTQTGIKASEEAE